MCWEKKQLSPIHDHFGSDCWIKVLDGQLHHFEYEAVKDPGNQSATCQIKQYSRSVFYKEDVTCNNKAGIHRVGNPSSDQVVVSLHIYSPP